MRTDAHTALCGGVYERLADQYADRLALNWRRRTQLLWSASADFGALMDWDERMDAALQALVLLGQVSDVHLRRRLDNAISAGEAFAMLCHAVESGNDELADATAAVAATLPSLQPALVGALAWCAGGTSWQRQVERLSPAARFDLVATGHRSASAMLDPALDALNNDDPASPAWASALRCLRHAGHARHASTALLKLRHDDERIRQQAARAVIALLPADQGAAAVDTLLTLARGAGPQAAVALLGLAPVQPSLALATSAALRDKDPALWGRTRVQVAGSAGQVRVVPELIELLDSPDLARVAAAAIRQITGLDAVRDDLQGPSLARARARDADALSAEIPEIDPDAGLAWPSRTRFAQRWLADKGRFKESTTYLGGEPVTAAHLRAVLVKGPLPWRRVAAARLQQLNRGALFPTQLPAREQSALLTS